MLHPLTGSNEWVEMDSGSVVTKIWGGRANLVEFKGEGPNGLVEHISLRTYSPVTHQWNVTFATPGVGQLGATAVGEFRNRRGEFYDQEPFNGRMILVRFSVWSTTPDTMQSEQAFSDDGGKTWEVNWTGGQQKEMRAVWKIGNELLQSVEVGRHTRVAHRVGTARYGSGGGVFFPAPTPAETCGIGP
ncbi:MAG: hypothetical protein JWO52_5344 [Gammaproteobacteria bacterium]|nr:hypothetical protein [Gammaproteobacteria bacterium]